MTPSPLQHLAELAKDCPGIWGHADFLRAGKGKDLPTWPTWCWLPMAAAGTLAKKYFKASYTREYLGQISRIAALTAWRLSQGIYRFNETLFKPLIQTRLSDKLPTEVFFRLPEYCVYIDTEGMSLFDGDLRGFWVHLEYDVNNQHNELRILLDNRTGLLPIILHLSKDTVYAALKDAIDEAERYADAKGISITEFIPTPEELKQESQQLYPLLSLVIYLCSNDPDISGPPVTRPAPVKTKKGLRYFPPPKPVVRHVGTRLGAVLQSHQASALDQSGKAGRIHTSPRPHIRRAHWHSYWTGPKRSVLKVYWLHPMLVGTKGAD